MWMSGSSASACALVAATSARIHIKSVLDAHACATRLAMSADAIRPHFENPARDEAMIKTVKGKNREKCLRHLRLQRLSRALNLNVAAIVCVVTVLAAYAQADDVPHTIEAQGHGEAVAKPDTAAITLSVVSKGATATEAVKKSSATNQAIASALVARTLANQPEIVIPEPSVSWIPRTNSGRFGINVARVNGVQGRVSGGRQCVVNGRSRDRILGSRYGRPHQK